MANKTAIIYRPMFDMEVKQEVDSMLYNVTDIVNAYTKSTGERKDLSNFMENQTTKDFINHLKNVKPGIPVFKIMRGKYWWTWLCEELVIDVMMWLSVEFKHMAIRFILDGHSLSYGRNSIKDWYKKMCLAIADSWSANFRDEATMLNVLVSGSPSANQRARYWEDQQRLMEDLQKANATMIRLDIPLNKRKEALIKEFLS